MGATLKGEKAPQIAEKPLNISAEIDAPGTNGVIVAQGGPGNGYAVYIKDGKLTFAVRESRELTAITAKDALGKGHFQVQATLSDDGKLALSVDGNQVADGKAAGLIPQQPRAAFIVGKSGASKVGDYETSTSFDAKVTNVKIVAATAK